MKMKSLFVTIRRGLSVLAIILLMIVTLITVSHVADRFFNPSRYVKQLSKGMTYDQVLELIPSRLVAEELHSISESRSDFGRMNMKQLGIQATDVMLLQDILWPITQATGCFLYFDENRVLVGWHITSS
jgi:hypothetical protein